MSLIIIIFKELWEEIDVWLRKLIDHFDSHDHEHEHGGADFINQYCGRENCCKDFEHEHVDWGLNNSMASLNLNQNEEHYNPQTPYEEDDEHNDFDLDL